MNIKTEMNKKLCYLLTFGALLSQLFVFSAANAEEIIDPWAGELTCDKVNTPADTVGWIVTVIEEQIGGEGPSTADSQVMDCMRVTTEGEGENAGKTTSQYQALGTCPANSTCSRVQVILSKSGATLLYTYISIIYKWAAGTIGIVAVLFLVWGGFEIATSGDSNRIDKAKERIMQSIAGLVILLLSGAILYTINPNFFTL